MGRERVTITDYKSSDVRDPAKARQRARESLQLQIYAMGYEAMTGRLPDAVALHFLDRASSARSTSTRSGSPRRAHGCADGRGRASGRAGFTATPDADGLHALPVPRHLPVERRRERADSPRTWIASAPRRTGTAWPTQRL